MIEEPCLEPSMPVGIVLQFLLPCTQCRRGGLAVTSKGESEGTLCYEEGTVQRRRKLEKGWLSYLNCWLHLPRLCFGLGFSFTRIVTGCRLSLSHRRPAAECCSRYSLSLARTRTQVNRQAGSPTFAV